MWVERIINLLCNFFLILIIIRYINIFFEPKNKSRIALCISAVGFYITSLVVGIMINIPILNFAVCIIGIFAMTCAFEGKVLKKILVTFSVAILNAVCDIIAYMILVKNNPDVQTDIAYVFTILLVLICEQIISLIMRNTQDKHITPDNFGVLILIPICSLVILYVTTKAAIDRFSFIVMATSVMIINLLVFYIYQKMLENYLSKFMLELAEERAKAYANEIDIMSRTQKRIRSIQHDMRHHIIELKNLLRRGRDDEMELYLNSMENAINITKEYAHSGNYQIDSLLNFLLQEANEKLEDVSVQIKIPSDVEINTFKVNTILGNLLENAIEAASQSDEKKLVLDIAMEKGVLYIQISNTYKGEVMKIGNEFVTSKTDKDNHGIGLNSVRELVEEENGSLVINVEEKLFKAEVMLYI